MTRRIDHLLTRGITFLQQGGTIEEFMTRPAVTALAPVQRDALRSLLETASGLRLLWRDRVPPPQAKAANRSALLGQAAQWREEGLAHPNRVGLRSALRLLRGLGAAALAIVLVAAVGVAPATAASLPGTTLYPLKLAAEDARLALTLDPSARVDLSLQLAEARTAEMLRLASESRPASHVVVLRMQQHLRAALQAAQATPGSAQYFWLQNIVAKGIAEENRLEEAGRSAPDELRSMLNEGADAAKDAALKAQRLLADLPPPPAPVPTTADATPTATAIPVVVPVASATSSAPASATATWTVTRSPEPQETEAPERTATGTASPSPSPTVSRTPSSTRTRTPTASTTPSPSVTPREDDDDTPEPTAAPSGTPSATRTRTPSRTPTCTLTCTPTRSPSATATVTPTATATAIPSETPLPVYQLSLLDNPDPVPAGHRIHYNVLLSNPGEVRLTHVIIVASWSPGCAYYPPNNPGQVTWDVGNIEPHSYWAVEFMLETFSIAEGCIVTAQADMTSDQGDAHISTTTRIGSPPPTRTPTEVPHPEGTPTPTSPAPSGTPSAPPGPASETPSRSPEPPNGTPERRSAFL